MPAPLRGVSPGVVGDENCRARPDRPAGASGSERVRAREGAGVRVLPEESETPESRGAAGWGALAPRLPGPAGELRGPPG